MNDASWIDATGAAMWALVERYTGQVGYKRGTKASGLNDHPPVIDCSGWTALLLSAGMAAANREAGRLLFSDADMAAVHTWSDRLIENLERRCGVIVTGDHITVAELPPFATIGLQQGGGAWASNHPRPRGITHVVQVVHRPGDHAPYVSEAQGMAEPYGLRLLPLAKWIAGTRDDLKSGMAWAVAPFAV
ncbi:hypothetical protein PQI07_00960 [Methylobacterium sp. 092160098-2]|uniref:hypothetical protein n=1 Tax=Methylobacterium sp. 092160098-2 TaxID=3025129 RepID=UPI002381AB3B|nr:hypothetical protein [Methylobacterium sp. 092160098-2]MDE4909270.1 hypothetical protein [Methylobacterium sp. 092160098-2]